MTGIVIETGFKRNGITVRKAVFCEQGLREYVAYEQERVEDIHGNARWVNVSIIQDKNREYVRTMWMGLIQKITYEEGNTSTVSAKEIVGDYASSPVGRG